MSFKENQLNVDYKNLLNFHFKFDLITKSNKLIDAKSLKQTNNCFK
jgi:hypothetical protein